MTTTTEHAAPDSGLKSFLAFVAVLIVLVGAGIGLGAVFLAPESKKPYDRSSPDEVLAAAKDMVLNQEAERLSELLYADTPEMEELYARLGGALGHLQDLAIAINEQFPEDVARAREEAETAAREGRAMSLLDQFNPANRSRRRGPPTDEDNNRWNLILQTIASDPYAWITETEGRLTYQYIDDERVAVLWDAKPIFPPFGLVMRQDQGQWSIVLPLNSIPMASRFMPQTPDEYSIWASLIQMADNVLIDLEADVSSGKMHSLDALARHTGEKAVIPMGMGMIAYNKALQERRKREREARDARDAERDAQQAGTEEPGGG